MGIEFSGFDDLEKNLRSAANAAAEEGAAEIMANMARERGLSNVDQIELDLSSGQQHIDEARVRSLANAILASRH